MTAESQQHNGSSAGNASPLSILEAVLGYHRAGLCTMPVRIDGSKAPMLRKWQQLQRSLPREEDLRSWFGSGQRGIAVICGRVSGNLETLDFETETVFRAWAELVEAQAPGLVDRLSLVRTPGHLVEGERGVHARYRCPAATISGNLKLAYEPRADGEGKVKRVEIIETRGEGGYAIAPGSDPRTHSSGRPWEHFAGPPLTALPEITPDERQLLLEAAASLNRWVDERPSQQAPAGGPLRPGDDYNRRGPAWDAILSPHGWEAVLHRGEVIYWRRPAKDRGYSATTGFCRSRDGLELLAVFSTNAYPFEIPSGRSCASFNKFAAHALLNHGGDFGAAARDLASKGYGGRPGSDPGQTTTPDGNPVWEEPIPLSGEHTPPPFPTELLPGPLARWVEAEAEATQTPPDLAGALVLAVAGAGLAGKVRVIVRQGWTEPLNLFTVVALLPGDRKSAVFADALTPVQEVERAEQERMAPIIAELASAHRVLEQRLKNTEAKAAKAEDAAEAARYRDEANQLAKELAAHHVPDPPQFYCDDITPEKLGQLLARQGGRMLQASAEGTPFEIAKGRYSETPNFDVYLKGHAGDPLRVGRVSRDSDTVDKPALSLALTVQPDVIHGLADQASLRGRGFLARFLYAIPVSRVGRRAVAPAAVPATVTGGYQGTIKKLWELPGLTNENAKQEPSWLRFSPEADRALQAFETWLEPRLGEGEDLSHLAGWAQKLAGAVARIAGILHVADAVSQDRPWLEPVRQETVERAIRLGRDYFLPHALAAFGMMGADPRAELGNLVLVGIKRQLESNEIVENAPPSVSRREIHQRHRRRFKTVEDLDPILDLLVKHGWLMHTGTGERGRGHRGPTYYVNPAVMRLGSETTPPVLNDLNVLRNGQADEHGDAWEGN